MDALARRKGGDGGPLLPSFKVLSLLSSWWDLERRGKEGGFFRLEKRGSFGQKNG